MTTTGLGHRRILRDERVVKQAVAFVKGEALPAGPGSAEPTPHCEHAARSAGLCDRCALEASLFFRDEREAYSASWKMMPSV